MYTYRVIKEDPYTGQQAKRSRTITKNRQFKIGGLYIHIPGLKGCWRVLELVEGSEEE